MSDDEEARCVKRQGERQRLVAPSQQENPKGREQTRQLFEPRPASRYWRAGQLRAGEKPAHELQLRLHVVQPEKA